MGGSKGGKHSKGKGKSKPMKNETSHTKLNSKHDLAHALYNNTQGLGDSTERSHHPQISVSSRYTENELEEFLFIKLEDLYTKAKSWLLKSGYDMANVERAILNNGYVHGPNNFLDNILTNTIAFIKQKVEPKGEAFNDMKQLYKAMIEAMIDSVLHTERDVKRSEAMWLLLVRKWGSTPSTSTLSGVLSGDDNIDSTNEGTSAPYASTSEKTQSESHSDSSSKKVEGSKRISATSVLRQIGSDHQDLKHAGCALIEVSNLVHPDILTFLDEEYVKRWEESSSNDLKTEFIADLIKSIRDLEEKVTVQKQWAQKKVIDSAKRLSKDLLELNMLKLEKAETQCWKDEKLCAESSSMLLLKEREQSLRNLNCQISNIGESIRILEESNAHIRANTEAVKLSTSEYGNKLNQVLNRERRCIKKLAAIGKQTSNLNANCDEEKQKVLQLQLDVSEAENVAKEAEDKWKQEIKEKEQMVALLAEETRKAGPHRANLKAELSEIRRKTEVDRNLKRDEVEWLERELSRLQLFHQVSNVSLDGDTFLYNGVEVTSLEHTEHWNCMICSVNEVSVVFLPCTHQVLCANCYEGSCSCSSSGSRQRCPYCGVEIEQCIKAYAPS